RGGRARLLDGGQQEADEHRDDGDDDQQLDQREAAAWGGARHATLLGRPVPAGGTSKPGTLARAALAGRVTRPVYWRPPRQPRQAKTPRREFRSGVSVRKRTRLSKAGTARLRQALYLPLGVKQVLGVERHWATSLVSVLGHEHRARLFHLD